ncbi:unnamed protein product [Arabidopsis halleri]
MKFLFLSTRKKTSMLQSCFMGNQKLQQLFTPMIIFLFYFMAMLALLGKSMWVDDSGRLSTFIFGSLTRPPAAHYVSSFQAMDIHVH